MAKTYKFVKWVDSRMIVDEYENGRYRNTYNGYVTDNGYTVAIYPIKGIRHDGRSACPVRRLRNDEIIRDEPRETARVAPPVTPTEEYDPTAWHRETAERMEGVQLTLRGLDV